MATKDFIITFVVLGLFIFSLLAFGIGIANQNDAVNTIADDPRFSALNTSLVGGLSEIESDTNSSRVAFESENEPTGFGEIIFESIISVGKTFTSGIVIFSNIIFGLVFDVIFGGDNAFAVVIGTILSVITIMIVFLLWKTYRSGD